MIVGENAFDKQKTGVLTPSNEYQQDIMTGRWEVSGESKHSTDCHGWFNWLHPKTLVKLSNIHKRKIGEPLEANNVEMKEEYGKSIKVLKRDQGYIVNKNSWKPLFCKIKMVRHANDMSWMFLRVRVNFIMYINSLCKTTNKPVSWLLLQQNGWCLGDITQKEDPTGTICQRVYFRKILTKHLNRLFIGKNT